MLLLVTFEGVRIRYGPIAGVTLYHKQQVTNNKIMKQLIALTIIAIIFTANVASAKQGPAVSTKATTTKTTPSTKKMKDTDDNLMSKQNQNSAADYFNTKAC